MRSMKLVGQRVQVSLPYDVQYKDPIDLRAGESLAIGRTDDDFPGWRWCRASDGREGWVPIELLSSEGSQGFILQDYCARELQVRSGEDVLVEDARHGWLLVRNMKGERGWIPADRVRDPITRQ
jgi:SH3-like domain-containing protein